MTETHIHSYDSQVHFISRSTLIFFKILFYNFVSVTNILLCKESTRSIIHKILVIHSNLYYHLQSMLCQKQYTYVYEKFNDQNIFSGIEFSFRREFCFMSSTE